MARIRTSYTGMVLRRGSGKQNGGKRKSISSPPGSEPVCPPSPDLSGLTPAEISILKDVFKRQEEFENEEKGRQEKLTEDLASFEENVKRQASQKGALKHVDLRLCRLCYKTKFADGIGKACYDCHKRVCNRCGSYTRPRWNAKKTKSVKGKWRCNMCQMKRDVLAKTGIWYHGSDGQPSMSGRNLEKKLSMSEMDSSENDGTGTGTPTDPAFVEASDSLERGDDSEVFSGEPPHTSHQRSFSRKSRHRSIPSKSSVDRAEAEDEIDIDDEQFQRERQLCRIQRHNRKCRRRLRSGSFSVSSHEWESERDLEPDYDRKNDVDTCTDSDRLKTCPDRVDYRYSSSETQRSPDKGYLESSFDRTSYIPKEFDAPYQGRSPQGSKRGSDVSSDSDYQTRYIKDKQKRFTDPDCRSLTKLRSTDSRKHFKSFTSGVHPPEARCSEYGNLSAPDSLPISKNVKMLPSRIPPNLSDSEDRQGPPWKPPQNRHLAQASSYNNLSPDMALTNRSRRKHKLVRTGNEWEAPSGERTKAFPPHSIQRQDSGNEQKDFTAGRRMTLAHCENLQLLDGDRQRGGQQTSKPHEILLHKDKTDTSQRTRGLGMRVIGGKQGPNGSTGAYVTMVIKGGPADVQGISSGDLVVSWNGHSLMGVTFEEAQEIIHKSGDIVQITVLHDTSSEEPISPVLTKKDPYPVIVRAATMDVPDSLPPDSLKLKKPKRRMLPKTPIEIKRDVRKISGKLWMQLDYDVKCRCILIVLLRGVDIWSQGQGHDDRQGPNPVVMFHLLPNRYHYEPKESEIRFNCSKPSWNETFVFPNVSEDELEGLSLEVTVWDFKGSNDTFLGEVLLDFGEAKIDNSVQCYPLEDHDENSSPLPARKKSFSLSESSIVSPVTSLEASSLVPSRNPSPRSSLSNRGSGSQPTLPTTPAHDKMRELLGQGKVSPASRQSESRRHNLPRLKTSASAPSMKPTLQSTLPSGRDRLDFSSSAHSSPLHSPTSPKEMDVGSASNRRSSFTTMVKRKMSHAMAKMSSSLVLGGGGVEERKENDDGEQSFNRSQSVNDVRRLDISSPAQNRRSFEGPHTRYSLLAPPHPLSRSNSSSDFFMDGDQDDLLRSPNPDRPAPEGDDITSLLGPGQVPPKPTFEMDVCGDIKMGFMVSKGQLEIDIIVVKGLKKGGITSPPDTYVKTYLVEGTKTIQKKKTHTIKISFDPVFRKKVKYSACNIHGRCIKVNVWEKQKTFDKKQCLGEAVVKLDSLDLAQHTLAWYKLFPMGSMDFGSNESLFFW